MSTPNCTWIASDTLHKRFAALAAPLLYLACASAQADTMRCGSALVSVGTQVRAGQPIALVGSSGGQGRPSLYFEIRRQGQAVNPQPWLGR